MSEYKHEDVWLTTRGLVSTDPEYAPYNLQEPLRLIAGKTPLQLCVSRDDYERLHLVVNDPRVFIKANVKRILEDALIEGKTIPPPILAPTEYQKIAWVDDVKILTSKVDVRSPEICLTKGKKYEFTHMQPEYKRRFKRRARDGELHECELKAKDSAFKLFDDRGQAVIFRDHTSEDRIDEIDEEKIWEYFEQPMIPTVADKNPVEYQANISALDMLSMCGNGFKWYPNQKEFVAAAAIPDSCLVTASTGCGKSLMAIGIMACKNAVRTLLVAPKGTVKGEEEDDASQWLQEFENFDPDMPVFKLFSKSDYKAIIRKHGSLPAGVYVTYDHAMFKTGAITSIPRSWSEKDREPEEEFRKKMGFKPYMSGDDMYHRGLGNQDRHGIRCIASPALCDEIGDVWDMMILDEAHLICNLKSAITQSIIRMQPKYRYALTATPIPNYVYNIFSLMGWLCVPGWYKGGKENLRWPYAKDNASQFTRQFMAREADITAALKDKIAPIYKPSPLIGMPTKLLKLLCPNMAFLSKEQCNPDLVPCNIIETRVPMGEMQHRAYTYWTDVDNIHKKMSHWRKYGVQLQYLRGVCATPKVGKHADLLLEQTGWQPDSQMTPKMISIIEKAFECIAKGEQVVIVYARCEMGSEIERRINEAGITSSRIDSEVLSRYHSRESNRFKRKETQVLLMGIKCAQAYSFQQCSNLIIASLEWSYGAYNQAVGRVYRLNSPKPVTVYVILTENSIEEAMYDKLGSKEDTAKVCMHGERVPKDVIPMDLSEVFADHLGIFGENNGAYVSEYECEDQWPDLLKHLNDKLNERKAILV